MRAALLTIWLTVGASLVLLVALPAYPHGGGLDAYGCHHNRKQGGYHCHRGPLAGQAFASQAEMLQRLKGKSETTSETSPQKRRQ